MSRINCEVTEDLLPLYVEHMASPSTRELVEEHLALCDACRKKAEEMKGAVALPPDVDTTPLERMGKLLFRKKVTIVMVTLLSVLLVVMLAGVHLNSPILIPYEDIKESVQISEENGRVRIRMDNKGGSSDTETYVAEDGVRVTEIQLYTTLWKQWTKVTAGESEFELETEGDNAVGRVYYFPAAEGGELVCIYDDSVDIDAPAGGMVMPRLVLNYYLFFAVVLSGIGIVVCIVLWKKKNISRGKRFLALKITCFPVAYTVASVAVLVNQGGVYHTAYYVTGILLVTAVLYIVCYWILEYLRYYGKKIDLFAKKR